MFSQKIWTLYVAFMLLRLLMYAPRVCKIKDSQYGIILDNGTWSGLARC